MYTDPIGGTEDRNHAGYSTVYTDDSGRNDITEIRVLKDAGNYYVYIRTADALTAPYESGWMTLFIDSGADGGFGNAWDIAVNRLKINEAIRLLMNTYVPIESIGPSLGYASKPFFYRMFKKFTGLTPGEMRKRTGGTIK